MSAGTYAASRRKNRWVENSLATADEDLSGRFDWHLIGRFLPYISRYKTTTWMSIVLMLVYTGLNLANPFLIGVAIDNFIGPHDLHGLAVVSIVLLVLNVAMWQAQYWQIWMMSWAGEQVLYHLSADMFTHLQRLALAFYDRTQIGRVMSRLQSDIDVLESMLSSGLLSMLSSVVALLGIVVVMLFLNLKLALLTFIVLPVMMLIAGYWQKHAERSFRQTRAARKYLRYARDPEYGPRGAQQCRVRRPKRL
jgi:ABC-type multidrug transport system fused ATPase/permease subunit